ncbi:MAG: M48 family metallopeptidase [Bacteroidetes bacterium]|nr:M48 family metallopeptidase [Bacteroidota bacterium]
MSSYIQFGSKQIEYQLKYSERKTLGITVNPDLSVLIKAPLNTPIQKIEEKLLNKASWIIKQQSFFLSFFPKSLPKKYVSGETHLYLGRQYRLKIEKSKETSVKLKGKYLIVKTPDKGKTEKLVKGWYLKNAKTKFHEYTEPLIEQFRKYNVEPESLVIRDMPTRWGSCTPKGKIILNPELIKAPRGCIEYVIIHELCHLVHHDHTKRFIDLQTKEMPNWERWKTKLEDLLK